MTATKSQRLINNGQPLTGRLSSLISEINFLDFDYRNAMDKPYSNWRKKMAFNQFVFFGITAPDLYIGIAIVNLRWVSNAFIYIFDQKNNHLEEHSFLTPLALGTQIELSPDHFSASFNNRKSRFRFQTLNDGYQVEVEIGDKFLCQAHFNRPDTLPPLRLCSPAGYSGWVYTQKIAGMVVSGSLTHQGQKLDLRERKCLGALDYSCGFMRRETVWKWTCINGFDVQGSMLGLNLANGVNETGMTENTLWFKDQTLALPSVQFHFSRYEPERTWQIGSEDSSINLTFQPLGKRESRENFGLLASNFRQYFGLYTGTINTPEWGIIQLVEQPGFAEDHYAKW